MVVQQEHQLRPRWMLFLWNKEWLYYDGKESLEEIHFTWVMIVENQIRLFIWNNTQEVGLFERLVDQEVQEHQAHLGWAPHAAWSRIGQIPTCKQLYQQCCKNKFKRRPKTWDIENATKIQVKPNLSPEAEQRSVHWICTVPASPELAHESLGRKAIWTLSLSFLAAKRETFYPKTHRGSAYKFFGGNKTKKHHICNT